MPAAARRARTPLFVLLALLIGGAIAVIAFLAGRTAAPNELRQLAPAPLTVRLQAATPAPVAPGVAEARRAPAATVSASTGPAARARPDGKTAVRRSLRSDRRGMVPRIERAFPLAPIGSARSRPTPAASAPSRRRANAAASRGGVVQLGAYVTMPLLDSAWMRLVAAYPYLATRPRMVSGTALPGRPYYYRLRVAAGSRREARALCDHLHGIGRGCMVVASAK